MAALKRQSETRRCENDCGRMAVEIVGDSGVLYASPLCEECGADAAAAEDPERAEIERVVYLGADGIPAKMAEWTIETYPRDLGGQAAYETAKAWLRGYERSGKRGDLYVYGPLGVGRTGLAVSVGPYLC